jgi:hypothetical protein
LQLVEKRFEKIHRGAELYQRGIRGLRGGHPDRRSAYFLDQESTRNAYGREILFLGRNDS